jgi:hypothetical protein
MVFLEYEKPEPKLFTRGQRVAFFLIHLTCVFISVTTLGTWFHIGWSNGRPPDEGVFFFYCIGALITSVVAWLFLKKQKVMSPRRLTCISVFMVVWGLCAFIVGIAFFFLMMGLAYIYSPP